MTFSGAMMIGYFAETDDTQLIKIDENEIMEAGWFTRGKLPIGQPNSSIAYEMIEVFSNMDFQ